MRVAIGILAILITLVSLAAAGDTDYYKQFKKDYNALSMDLLNHTGEYGEISNFVYTKDVATFTFESGIIHFLRYVDDRPTTAVFIGQGTATIAVPSHVERAALQMIARDSVIQQEFGTCFMRLGDDFDLALKEKFTFEPKQLSWKNFNKTSKQDQGELFFKPVINHTYDNYFQLLRSIYDGRGDDGYFWIDFNRYVFTYDPNRPEEVVVSYEREGGDMVITEAARMQKQASAIYDDQQMSEIAYPTTMLDRFGQIEMGGMDGKFLENAQAEVTLQINADSLRFISLFLHYNLKIDSMYYQGERVDFHRRKTFGFVGVILPEYRHQGDTVKLTAWYRGKQFDHAMPYVENPAVTPHAYEFVTPKGYSYFMPGQSEVTEIDRGKQSFSANPSTPYNKFYFACYASGLDTLAVPTQLGMNMNFLIWELMNKKYSDCFIPHEIYQPPVKDAFDFLSSKFGGPLGTFEVFASPGGTYVYDMPGFMIVPQIACVNEGSLQFLGGVNLIAGRGAARQWFGPLMRIATDRESWLTEAAAEYAAILYLQHSLGSTAYSNLANRRDSVYSMMEIRRDLPLACGDRVHPVIQANKGLWVLHMLRMMMYDLETGSDAVFMKFMYELVLNVNNRSFSNTDFVALAEKHYGQDLSDFFRLWLYGAGIPEYDIKYAIAQRDGGYFVDVDVAVKNVDTAFAMPVIMHIASSSGQSVFERHQVSARGQKLELGPYDFEPEKLVFNEFFSVLCKESTQKK